jgi:5-methyltetrahydropteroyltriglutamate--homocysteine methyltransferase
MKRSEGRILTTHAGSLPRTDALVNLLAAQNRGESVDTKEFAAEVEASTRDVIEKQHTAGIDVGNSGEQSRISFSTYVTLRMSGFGGSWRRRFDSRFASYAGIVGPVPIDIIYDAPKCIGPVGYERLDEAEKECDDLLKYHGAGAAQLEELFMTAASPGIISLTMLNEHYPTYEEYVLTLAEEMRKEYELIVSKGLILQLDCPDLAMERSVSYQDEPISAFQELVRLHIRAINQAIRNIPPEQVRLHVCWGNGEAPHTDDVPLSDILPLLYDAKVGALVMEMANPRHAHEHKVYQRYPLPEHMLLVAGVIDTKTNYVEHPEVVADRIELAVKAVGDPTRVVAGTDCGFATIAGTERVQKDIVWQKLGSMRQGADIASQVANW